MAFLSRYSSSFTRDFKCSVAQTAAESTLAKYECCRMKSLPIGHQPADCVPFSKLHNRHEETSIPTHLRTGKARLNHYLHRIKAAENELCEQCGRPETIHHFLYVCVRLTIERAELLQRAGIRGCDMLYILGGWFNERLDGPRRRWEADISAVKATIAFAKATGRLQSQLDG